jgi:hypothetical protein
MTEPQPELDPMSPGERICASCWYWHHNSPDPAWCDAAMGYTDPAFSCQDWRDMRERRGLEGDQP